MGRTRWRYLVAAGLLGFAAQVSPLTPAEASAKVACHRTQFQTALQEGGEKTESVVGELCIPRSQTANTVQVLVSGSTYGRVYWDFPLQPNRYSYVRALTTAGFATFNYDRVGVGRSSHPTSTTVTMEAQAFIAHKIVQGLRKGTFAGHRFRRVIIAGHSLGSFISEFEARTYQDVNGLIVTGNLHSGTIDPTLLPEFGQAVTPASLDPRFAGKGLDVGYLTTRPDTRGGLFYASDDADPAVIKRDELTKETVTAAEFATQFEPSAAALRIPVLIGVGQRDRVNCYPSCANAASVATAEDPSYSPAPVTAYVLARSGHVINLARNANDWFRAAIRWSIRSGKA